MGHFEENDPRTAVLAVIEPNEQADDAGHNEEQSAKVELLNMF